MKKRVIRSIIYTCGICHTDHSSKAAAQKCESMPIEERGYKIGDRVRNIEPRTCNKKDKPYHFTDKVVKIIGPIPFDFEYEVKWLGGRGLNQHVFQYEVSFSCPQCGEKRRERYYAPELQKTG